MKIVFMGTPAAARVSLARLITDGHDIRAVYTQPDRPSGRGNKITFSPVKELAIAEGLHLLQPAKIKTPDAAEEFSSFNADVAVVVAYGRILPEAFLSAFPHGAINLHFSLLPKYRGAAPVNWAIVNGETETGVTTIKMDAGLDTGKILMSRSVEIGKGETAVDLMNRLAVLGADVLSVTLRDLDEIIPVAQDDSLASFAPIMKREDGMIDWSWDAAAIVNRVRGFQPFPGTFTYFEGRKVSFWSVKALAGDGQADHPEAGTVVAAGPDQLLIMAGEGTMLDVSEIQFEGKKRMLVRDALNGAKLRPGDQFGPL